MTIPSIMMVATPDADRRDIQRRGRRASDHTDPMTAPHPESWLHVITKLGGYGSIAVYLVYQLSTRLDTQSTEMLGLMHDHVKQSTEASLQMSKLVNIALADCVNQAGVNAGKRNDCFRALYAAPTQ